MDVVVFYGCCNKVPQMEWLNRNLLFHTPGSLEVQDQLIGGVMLPPFEGAGRESVPTLLVSGGLLASLAVLDSWTRHLSLCLPLHVVFSLCVCIFILIPFYMDTSLSGLGVTLLQYDLILTNYSNNCISK